MKKFFATVSMAALLLGTSAVFAAAPKQTEKTAPATTTSVKKGSKKHTSKHHKAKAKAKTTGK